MIGTNVAPDSHSAIFGLYEAIFWLRTLCPCAISGNLVSKQSGRVGQSPPSHLPPHWAEWKSSKSWIFQHFLKRVLDVRFYFSRWLLDSSSRARHSWSISKHFLGLINVPYGVAEMVRPFDFWKSWYFWIFSNVAPTPLEGPLVVLVDWKVVSNASFGCLGVPGVDFG